MAFGTGLIVLLVLWILTIIISVIFCATSGALRFVSLIPISISTITTLVLALIPREGSTTVLEIDNTVYSYTSLIWILILTIMIVTFVISLFIYLISEIIQPRYAKVGRTIGYN